MARAIREAKIIEIVNKNAIEKQQDLVRMLRAAGFRVTQATVSRDIKNMGLIKVLDENRRYRYVYVNDSEEITITKRYMNIFKNSFISAVVVGNTVFIKTLKGLGFAIESCLERLEIRDFAGASYGNDSVAIYFEDEIKANQCEKHIDDMING